MPTRIYRKDNYLIAFNETSGQDIEYPVKDITYIESSDVISITSIYDSTIHKQYKFTDLRDEDGNVWADVDTLLEWLRLNTGGQIPMQVDLATNDLGRDAWGRPKVILDFTLFSALWSYSVPNRVWLQFNDIGAGDVEQSAIDNNLVKSTHGHLKVTSNDTTDVYLRSKRHPRYQPNKGMLYSTATIMPDPNFVGNRSFGLLNQSNGVYFKMIGTGASWTMNVVRDSTIGGVLTTETVDITAQILAKIPSFDPSKGHVYDIQMEWRGVGDFYIYVDLQLVYTFEMLGTLTELSVANPALPVGWKCDGAEVGNDLVLIAGCVDVTSEGGHKSNKMYTSINTGTTLLATTNTGVGIVAMRVPIETTYDGVSVSYTRDLILTQLTSFCKDEAFISVYMARINDVPNLEVLAGWNVNSDSLYEFRDNSDGALDTAFQLDKASMENIYSIRNEKDFSISHTNPDADHADFYLTGGDILLVELKSDNNSTGGATLEFAEEV